MIKNYLDRHIEYEKIDFDDELSYSPDGTTKYVSCGAYSQMQLESAILVCNYYKEKHFCFIRNMENAGFPEGYFNIMVLKSEYHYNMGNEIRYLIENVERKRKEIEKDKNDEYNEI